MSLHEAHETYLREEMDSAIAKMSQIDRQQILTRKRVEVKKELPALPIETLEEVSLMYVRQEFRRANPTACMSFEEFCRTRKEQQFSTAP